MENKCELSKLYIWRDQMLFLSSGPISSHLYKTAFHKLVVCINKPVCIELGDGTTQLSNSYLIKAGTYLPESLTKDDSVKAVYYLSTTKQDYYALSSLMKPAKKNIFYDHPNVVDLIKNYQDIREQAFPQDVALERVRRAAFPKEIEGRMFFEFDQRIIQILKLIQNSFMANLSVSDLAEKVCLSTSRLEKLFKKQIGVPITTYRMRFRVFLAVIQMCKGATVTEAALASGFSNLAHFSRCFASLVGIQPSAIFGDLSRIEVYIAQGNLMYPEALSLQAKHENLDISMSNNHIKAEKLEA